MIVLREGKAFDALAVAQILGEFVDTTPWMPRIHSPADDLAHAQQLIARGWVCVAERDSTILGFSACNGADVQAVYVTASQRGQGVGRQLLDALKARQDRLELWTFQANLGAQRFYERHGFRETRRTEGSGNDERLPDILYAWQKDVAA